MGAAGSGLLEAQPRQALTHSDAASLNVHGVLAFCTWEQRAAFATLNRDWRGILGLPAPGSGDQSAEEGAFHWHFLCLRLEAEHNMHVPKPWRGRPSLPPKGVAPSWQSLFSELFPARRRLDGTAARRAQPEEASGEAVDAEAEGQFSIKVAARFRPAAVSEVGEQQEVVLPLHQKVQIVRERYGCTRREAMEIIVRERGQKSLGDPFVGATPLIDGQENRGVPAGQPAAKSLGKVDLILDDDLVLEEEEDDGAEGAPAPGDPAGRTSDARASILAVQPDSGSVLAVAPGVGLRDFRFNVVFNERSRQADAYDASAQRLVMDFLNGMNTSIICYGQTGSGKTYTMFGPPGGAAGNEHGIVPRACEEVLEAVRDRRSRGLEVQLGMSYVEVFGSEISDLLREGRVVGQGQEGRYAHVRATDRVGHRYVLDGCTDFEVESWYDVQQLLEAGDKAKRLAATAMNERSTRAHALLVLSLRHRTASGYEACSRLFLADLGGSEKISKSKADAGTMAPVTVVGGVEQNRIGWQEYYLHRGRIQETQNINKGLFALKKVIDALHLRSQLRAQGAPAHLLPYVPYQDSKLTMLLQDALGGRSRTLVFCTASMNPCHAVESIQTMRFGERCAQVQQQGVDDKAASVQAALRQLAEEIGEVEAEIVKKERWETRLLKRRDVDTIGGAFGAEHASVLREEVIPTSVLVGAEQERERLEQLLQRQRDLQGLIGDTKDYRDMAAREAADGGRGRDFREVRFKGKMKAKEYESEVVVAEALRFLFRKAADAPEVFGETEVTQTRRLNPRSMHHGYFHLAGFLRRRWEEASGAEGSEKRSFGKSMMDQVVEWTAAFKESDGARDEALRALLRQAPIPEKDARE